MAAREGNIVYFASPKPGSYSPENQDKPVHVKKLHLME